LAALSGSAGWSLEEVAAGATGPLMWQLYHYGDRAWVKERFDRAQAAGYRAICLTVDTALPSRRERDIEHGRGFVPRPGLTGDPSPTNKEYGAHLTWGDVEWMRQQVRIPFGLKGILHPHDAVRALDYGVDFLWISNHGGRQLDDTCATIDALPEIADAIAGRIPLVVDGGFRRGTDVIKGLAWGATLVAVGRPAAWGLAVAGADGVQQTLRLLNEELRINLGLAGLTSARRIPRHAVRRVRY
jgi:4-hydroxymandelate oxidase